MAFFNDLFTAAARTVPQGAQIGASARMNAGQQKLLEAQIKALEADSASLNAVNTANKDFMQTEAGNIEGIKFASEMKKLAVLDPRERKMVINSVQQRLAGQGINLAPEALEFLTKADEEVFDTFLTETMAELVADPSQNSEALIKTMADGPTFMKAATDTMISVAERRKETESQGQSASEMGGVTPNQQLLNKQRQEKMMSEANVMRMDKQISAIESNINSMIANGVKPEHIKERYAPYQALQQLKEQRKLAADKAGTSEGREFDLEKGEISALESKRKEEQQRQDELAKRSPIQVFPQKGDPFTVLSDGRGGFYDPSTNQKVQLPAGARIAASNLQGSAEDIGLSKKAAGEIETRLLDVGEGIQRVERIMESFDPKFLETMPQLMAKGLGAAEELGITLSDSQKQFVEDYSAFARRTAADLNATIRAITGAAMAVQETDRLTKQIATLEDSPTQFTSKIKDTLSDLKASNTRLQMLRIKGFTDDQIKADASREGAADIGGISLEDAKSFEKRAIELRDQVINGKLTKEQMKEMLKKEFL